MYSVLSQRNRNESSILCVLLLVCIVCRVVCGEVPVPLGIQRRLGGDIVYFESTPHEPCNENNNKTYIVDERRCESDDELLNGMNMIYTFVYLNNETTTISSGRLYVCICPKRITDVS